METIKITKVKRTIFFALCLSFISIHVFASVDDTLKKKLVFAIMPAEREYLHYIHIRNGSEQSLVHYILGELEVHSGEKSDFLIWKNVSNTQVLRLRGDSIQGVNTNLLSACRSRDFVVPKNCEVSFFRSLCLDTHGELDMVDRTELVLALAESGSNQILVVLDSVGVASVLDIPTKDASRLFYGTEPQVAVRRIQVPALAEGKKCYLQLIPKRYGPTPLGLSYSLSAATHSFSTVYTSKGTLISPDFSKSIVEQYYKNVCEYIDAYIKKEGHLPIDKPVIPAKFNDDFLSKYYRDCNIIDLPGEGNRKMITPKLPSMGSIPIAMNISPNPVTNLCTLDLNVLGEQPSTVILLLSTDSRNSKKLPLWSGSIQKGKSKISVEIPQDIPNGTFMIVIEDAMNHVLGTGKMILMR